ncbi:MAG: FGGY-family carbohydrate kinase, partial [Herbinix sp.]|nr:FGGY-family carbohydrate kinase [Herbinix sp.]
FKEMNMEPTRVITAGGGTKNRTWMQIISDILGMEITIPEDYQSSAYGDAMMAAIGVGTLKDFKDLKAALPKGTVIKPNMENHKIYEKYYKNFIKLYLNNKELMHELKEL